MESGIPLQTRFPLPNGDLLATTPRASGYQSSLSPDDGYNYSDSGPSPEGTATQEQDNINYSQRYLQASASPNAPGHFEEYQGDSNPDYRRLAEEWRAHMPDDEDAPDSGSSLGSIREQWSPAVNRDIQRGRVHSQIERTLSITIEPTGTPHLRYVLLQWKKEEVNGAQQLILNALLPGNNAKVESINHVIWQ